jgi:hypothetical protein
MTYDSPMPVTDTKRLTLRFTPDMVRMADGLVGRNGRRTRQSVISAAVWIGLREMLTDQPTVGVSERVHRVPVEPRSNLKRKAP